MVIVLFCFVVAVRSNDTAFEASLLTAEGWQRLAREELQQRLTSFRSFDRQSI